MSYMGVLGLHRFLIDIGGLLLAGLLVVWSTIPDEFVSRMGQLAPYMITSAIVYVFVAMTLGVNRAVWRFTSLEDLGLIALAIGFTIIGSLGIGFVINRLDGVFRSLPILQGVIAVFASWLVRACFVLNWRLRNNRRRQRERKIEGTLSWREHILVVGVNEVANLYIRSIHELAGKTADIIGLLSQEDRHIGRLIQQYKVLGRPIDVLGILAELRVHGVQVGRIVVTMPFGALSQASREALLEVERGGGVELVHLGELLGLQKTPPRASRLDAPAGGSSSNSHSDAAILACDGRTTRQSHPPALSAPRTAYTYLKPLADGVGALLLALLLFPVVVIVSLLVLINDGTPLLFWQQRPGRHGEPIRVYKFRTMRRAHDADGTRVPDAERTSSIGRFLRRTRLDELPQLYHVIVGEMSFIGPRPLLAVDQDVEVPLRLAIRPGITGYAQVCGCNRLSIDEKMTLDAWYVENTSLTLDISILLKTFSVLLFGERRDEAAIARAAEWRRQRDTAVPALAPSAGVLETPAPIDVAAKCAESLISVANSGPPSEAIVREGASQPDEKAVGAELVARPRHDVTGQASAGAARRVALKSRHAGFAR